MTHSTEHLIGANKEGFRDLKPQGLRGPEVNHQFESRRLLHGKVARISAFQNLISEIGRASCRERVFTAV